MTTTCIAVKLQLSISRCVIETLASITHTAVATNISFLLASVKINKHTESNALEIAIVASLTLVSFRLMRITMEITGIIEAMILVNLESDLEHSVLSYSEIAETEIWLLR
jgi:hypothetical protein